jgi:hypothetical protein
VSKADHAFGALRVDLDFDFALESSDEQALQPALQGVPPESLRRGQVETRGIDLVDELDELPCGRGTAAPGEDIVRVEALAVRALGFRHRGPPRETRFTDKIRDASSGTGFVSADQWVMCGDGQANRVAE